MSEMSIPIGRRDFVGNSMLALAGTAFAHSRLLAAEPTQVSPSPDSQDSAEKRLAFSIDEYRERVARVQRLLVEKHLDALLCYNLASICYLTGLESIAVHKYWLCLIPQTGEPVLLMQDFESHNASISAWVDRIVTYEIFADPVDETVQLLKSHDLADKSLGVELGALSSLSVQDYLRLKAAVPLAKLTDATDLVPFVARIKSPAEIAYLRESGRISSAAMQAALAVIAEGRTDNDVAAAAAECLIREGSEYMCYQPIVTVGPRSGVPHSTFQRIPIRRGDSVFMEFGACVRRYSSPIMRTAVLGTPSDKLRQMVDLCLASVNTSLSNLKPGAISDEVALASELAIGPLPKGWVWHGYYAYSIGLGFPSEWADCGEIDVVKGSRSILKPGMVFHCSTSIRDPGQLGATCSETVLITETGCETLTQLPRRLFVL